MAILVDASRLRNIGMSTAAIAVACGILVCFYCFSNFIRGRNSRLSASPEHFQEKAHTPDASEPSSYKRPTPQAYPDWSIETTKPLPYRAFRYGPKYHITLGLRKIETDEWMYVKILHPSTQLTSKESLTTISPSITPTG